jgi:hypothetical protein
MALLYRDCSQQYTFSFCVPNKDGINGRVCVTSCVAEDINHVQMEIGPLHHHNHQAACIAVSSNRIPRSISPARPICSSASLV